MTWHYIIIYVIRHKVNRLVIHINEPKVPIITSKTWEGCTKMSRLWAAVLVLSVLYGLFAGFPAEVGAAAMEGAPAAVEFMLTTGALICLWSGVMEIMRRAGLMDKLSRALSPVLRRLFPRSTRDAETLSALTGNVSANLLGLGNAATPMGVRAAERMARGGHTGELCLLVVVNTASLQLLPTTAASLRAAEGAAAPFDILPAVWLSSICSVCAGIAAAKLLARLWRG